MSITIDLIIIAIILLFTFLGYKRGLVKLAIGLCTFFIAIVIAFFFYKPVANIVIDNTNIDESIETTITEKLLPEGKSETEDIEVGIKLPNVILENSENNIKSIAKSFSNTIISTVCFLVIFIATKIILRFVTFIADLIAKLPILKQFNKLGGTIYGILEGLLIVFVIFAGVSILAPLLDASILENINNSMIGSYLYNNNIILEFIA